MAMSISSCGFRALAATGPPLCGLWLAFGDRPTAAEIETVGKRYAVVVLNAWETDKMRLLRSVNPEAQILVYKDLSSTRSYAGAFDDGRDSTFLPTGVGYGEAQQSHPDWFAVDAGGQRIEWSRAYPGHWQMAVWDRAYQEAWTDNVVNEVIREGWDGVLADNDLAQLDYYSERLIAGTTSTDETNQRLRDGLDAMITMAGERMNQAGKSFIPNTSEARLTPGRWTAHSRFGGAMVEYFAVRGANGQILPMDSAEWDEMLGQADRDAGRILLVTHGTDPDDIRTGFAAAALLADGETCWMPAPDVNYTSPGWSPWQDIPIGGPVGPPTRDDSGVWHRQFANGWVAVNPTPAHASIEAPDGMRTVDGRSERLVDVAPGNSAVLVRSTRG
jgi:hypothetical protein